MPHPLATAESTQVIMSAGHQVKLLVSILLISYGACCNERPVWLGTRPTPHPCRRTCEEGDVRTCHYTFEVERYYTMSKACYNCPDTLEDCAREDCVTADGVPRLVTVVNRQLPGPSIEVCFGDQIVVDVHNKMNDEAVAIHWHGLYQDMNVHMDGVPYVTQCPIIPNTVFRYTMNASDIGSQFWHSHSGAQRGEGVFGPLIIRAPRSLEDSISLYDLDLSENIIIVNDWTHMTAVDKLHYHVQGVGTNKGDTILVNGRGRFYNDTVSLTNTSLAVFTVQQGYRYRFRLINSGILNCPQELYIDKHNITVFATDGHEIEPVKVEALVSFAAERWDFVLCADQAIDNYFIRFTGLQDCGENATKAHQVAVLHYQGAPPVEPSGPVGYNIHPTPKRLVNPVNMPYNDTKTICVAELVARDRRANPALKEEETDIQLIIDFDFFPIDNPLYHKSHLYGFHQVNSSYQRYTPQMTHVSFKTPHSPLLTQYEDIDPDFFCENKNLSACPHSFCECISITKIPLHSSVELILVDTGTVYNANHPFHLHGYGFRVVAQDRLGVNTSLDDIFKLQTTGKLVRHLEAPPFKDTVTVPDGGYTILRFVADNPGYWFFHCHIEFHLEVQMALVFKVGEEEDFPPTPKGFPRCGDFKPYS